MSARSLRLFDPFSRDRDNLGGGGGDFDEDTGGPGDSKPKGGKDADEDEDEDDEDETGDDDTGDEDDADDGPPKKPDGTPYTQADIDALKLALRKERKAKRGTAKDDADDAGDDAGDKAAPDKKALSRARAEGEEAAVATWKPLVVNSAAKAALSSVGLIGKPDRLLRLIDLDEVDVDPESGELDGLDEQVADLKREYPHLFRKKGTRNLDAADKDGTRKPTSKMTASEIQGAQLRGEL
jgi:hypothetical protein